MNLDKGNQTVGGTEMTVIGHVGKPDDGTANYVLLTRGQHGAALSATTAPDGSLWLVFGTDSGFEARSELYYSRLTVWIDTVDKPNLWLESGSNPPSHRLIWNSSETLQTLTDLGAAWTPATVTNRPYVHTNNETKRFWRVGPVKSR
jgi:hypothetical protein